MIDANQPGDPPDPDAEHVRATRKQMCLRLISERRMVTNVLGIQLCASPNWDMLLDLYLAEMDRRTIYQTALCQAAHLPESSAHRWTAKLAGQGVLVRESDPADRRRVRVTLARSTKAALDRIMDGLLNEH